MDIHGTIVVKVLTGKKPYDISTGCHEITLPSGKIIELDWSDMMGDYNEDNSTVKLNLSYCEICMDDGRNVHPINENVFQELLTGTVTRVDIDVYTDTHDTLDASQIEVIDFRISRDTDTEEQELPIADEKHTFKLLFENGYSLVLNKAGDVLGFYEPDGTLEGTAEDFPEVHGIWYDDEQCTIPWDEVVDYEHTDFHLTSCMYLDNGQVVDEGLIVAIEINGITKWDIRED